MVNRKDRAELTDLTDPEDPRRYSHPIIDSTIEIRLSTKVYKDMPDAELEDLVGKIEDELDLGLAAVGRAISQKLGGGKLTYRIK